MKTFANLVTDCFQCTGHGPSLHIHHFRDFYIPLLPKEFQPMINCRGWVSFLFCITRQFERRRTGKGKEGGKLQLTRLKLGGRGRAPVCQAGAGRERGLQFARLELGGRGSSRLPGWSWEGEGVPGCQCLFSVSFSSISKIMKMR